MSKTLMLPRPPSYCESHKQNPAMIAEMDRLLDDYNYADVARILNEKGFKIGDGLPLTTIAVGYVRKAYALKSRSDRLRERGMLTISQMARTCGVSIYTIGHWRQKGLSCAHAINDRTQFLLEDPRPNHRRSTLEEFRLSLFVYRGPFRKRTIEHVTGLYFLTPRPRLHPAYPSCRVEGIRIRFALRVSQPDYKHHFSVAPRVPQVGGRLNFRSSGCIL
jgi:hypothetical protein